MNIALDLDGTISAYPEHLKFLARLVRRNGGKVTVLTGAVQGIGPGHDPGYRTIQLHKLYWHAGVDFDELVICVGKDAEEVGVKKAEWMAENDVSIFADDTEMYIEAAKKRNPKMIVLRIAA